MATRISYLRYLAPRLSNKRIKSHFLPLPRVVKFDCKPNAVTVFPNCCLRQPFHPSLFHTSSWSSKAKSKKAKKMEIYVDPKDVEDFFDLESVLSEMNQAVENLKNDYIKKYRVGGDINLLHQLVIELGGEKLELHEVAQIKKKSEKSLQLDFVSFPEAMHAAELAIQSSNLNLNPSIKGTKMEIRLPPITTEHRKEIVKAAKQRLNDCKEEIKRIRNKHERLLKNIEKLSEDSDSGIRKQISEYVSITQSNAENLFKAREKDLLLK